MKKKNNYSSFLFSFLIICIYNLSKCDDTVKCPEGFIAKDNAFCPTIMNCPGSLMRVNLYTCSYVQQFAPPSNCKMGRECWNGQCVSSSKEINTLCPSYFSCPSNDTRIKCPDNTCVNQESECPDYVECPPFNPIRCGNGDCRKSLSDCPSFIKCPDKYPVLCNDGSCRATKNLCTLPTVQTKCSDKKKVRCPDGTCTDSKNLCPTLLTCPVGYEKCYDGNCKPRGTCFSDSTARLDVCNQISEVLCQFDFSCSKDISSCPTGIICPVDKPVKCWDNSCRDSIESCPAYQKCPAGLKSCPDGSCGVGECGTHITCSKDAPYRCFDNTCRRNPEDCPAQPSCPSETPILCWDGRCLAERGECLAPSSCDTVNPVKCPNGLCYISASSCKEVVECPSEFVRCKDGSCRKKLKYCPDEACPVNLPFKCKNGLCVSKEILCDKDNGCPFYIPIKCSDGSCAESEGSCPPTPKCPNSGDKLCPDGSCVGIKDICPSINGCPIDTPFRCANGECINLKKSNCSIPICDANKPIKCFDGTCVKTTSSCPTERKIASNGRVICADGTQAVSYEECKPIVACQRGEIRCDDGSCRTEGKCPLSKTCPDNQIRCANGTCASSLDECPSDNGCTQSVKEKCENTGLCVTDLKLCKDIEDTFNKGNGCPTDKPYKCPATHKCVVKEDDCEISDSFCNTEKGEVMCSDGYCSSNGFDDCNLEEHDKNCGYGGLNIGCSNEPDPCAKTVNDCYNNYNCKLSEPYRCTNGECSKYPLKSSSGNNGCDIGIECPNYKSTLCADGSCVETPSFCKSFKGCSGDKPYLCSDKSCAKSKEDCPKNLPKCPSKSPLLCQNGNCGAGIYDCNEGNCPLWLPIYCVFGHCTDTPRVCQELIYHPETKSREIGTICEKGEFVCLDGSCRSSPEECPIYPGCVNSDASFKCLDGSCAQDKDSCNNGNDPLFLNCTEGTTLCEDGLCRDNCSIVEFYGCPNEHPLLCPNGRCVDLKIECAGESACDSTEKPFRCIDGTCGASLEDCKIPFREVGVTNVTLNVFPKIEASIDLILGPNNLLSGRVEIPAETITRKSDNSSAETQIAFRSISRNYLIDTYSEYDQTRVDDLRSIYPYSDPDNNYTLTYQYTVLSSAIKVNLREPNETQIAGKVLLTLLFDFPHLHEKLDVISKYEDEDANYQKTSRYTTLPLNYKKDVCLGKLDVETRKWECTGLNYDVAGKSELQLTGEINEDGIYAVILHLRRNDNLLYIEYNWFLAHLKLLTIIFLIILLLIGIGIYIFGRIYRYRQKYKGTKEVYEGYEVEINDLKGQSVQGRQGQTYADVKEGIIYTDNVAFKSQGNAEARKKNHQLEKIFDAYTKKLRLLERNNALLKGQYDSIKNEYNRLNNYKDTLKEGDKVQIKLNINDEPNQISQKSGIIDDDD